MSEKADRIRARLRESAAEYERAVDAFRAAAIKREDDVRAAYGEADKILRSTGQAFRIDPPVAAMADDMGMSVRWVMNVVNEQPGTTRAERSVMFLRATVHTGGRKGAGPK